MKQYTRQFGVADLEDLAELCLAGDFSALEGARVMPDTRVAPKAWSKDLTTEWTMLLRQFGSGDAISFAVPMLTPLLRRGIDFDQTYDTFNQLWDEYEYHLLSNLTARWLVSTLDTYILNPRSETERAWAFAGAFFMKTIKVYETELLRLKSYPKLPGETRRIDTRKMRDELGRPMLFEGIQPFNILAGDMIEKMGLRLEAVKSDELCYKITLELWKRAHLRETAYSRIAMAVAQSKQNKTVRLRNKAIKASVSDAVFVRSFDVSSFGKISVYLPEGMEVKPIQEVRPSCHPDAEAGDLDLIVGEGRQAEVYVVLQGTGRSPGVDDIALLQRS